MLLLQAMARLGCGSTGSSRSRPPKATKPVPIAETLRRHLRTFRPLIAPSQESGRVKSSGDGSELIHRRA